MLGYFFPWNAVYKDVVINCRVKKYVEFEYAISQYVVVLQQR